MKNKKSLTVGIIVAVIVIALIGSIAGSYNNLVKLRENVTSAQSVVETQLQRRADLIPPPCQLILFEIPPCSPSTTALSLG